MANLNDLKSALLTVTSQVFHGFPPQNVMGSYIVWAEDGEVEAVWSSNKRRLAVKTGTVDFFTKAENDPDMQKIEAALDSIRIGWRLNSIQYEPDTGYIHYEWRWEMI